MAVLTYTCPHCNAERMTFRVIGAAVNLGYPNKAIANIGAECQKCSHPISAEIENKLSHIQHSNLHSVIGNLLANTADIGVLGYTMREVWPKAAASRIPDHLPPEVEKAFRQGEFNHAAEGNEDAAATMYRRSLDVGLKKVFPELKGDLFKKVEKLVQDNIIPSAIGDWAHQVRIIGAEGAHDLEGVTREDCDAARDFVDAVLRYTFSLPKTVEERRAKRDPPTPPAAT